MRKIILINGKKYEFINYFANTRNGFKHSCEMYIDNSTYPSASGVCHYLNRTWEKYTYQSVMRCTLNNYITEQIADAIFEYKTSNNLQRLSKNKREKISTETKQKFDFDAIYQALE